MSPEDWPRIQVVRRRTVALIALAAIAVAGLLMASVASADPAPLQLVPAEVTLFPAAAVPGHPTSSDASAVELGVKFTSDVAGEATGVRFYKGSGNGGTHVGHLWSSSGQLLATVTFVSETGSGWQTAFFPRRTSLTPGATYTVSYLAPNGHYAADPTFAGPVDNAPLHAGISAGVYRYGTGNTAPTQTYAGSNYWVDPVFKPAPGAGTTTTAVATTTTTAAPTTTTEATTTTVAPTTTTTAPGCLPVQGIPVGFPSQCDTGYTRAPGYPGSLHDCSGLDIQSGQTYSWCDFPGGLAIRDTVHDVTFFGSRITSNDDFTATYIAGNSITFDYVTVEPSAVTAPPVSHTQGYGFAFWVYPDGQAHGLTVNHADLWGFANAIQIDNYNQAHPLIVANSWFHDARDFAGIDHTDGILSNVEGVSYGTFDHNTMVSVGSTNAIALQTGPVDHITVTRSYFSGWGRAINIGGNGPNTNVIFTDNVWGSNIEPFAAPLYSWSPGAGNTWHGNTFHVAPNGYTPFPADGSYWWPDSADGPNPPGHATDFTG